MARHAWVTARTIARELDDLAFVFSVREAVSLKVDEATSTLVFVIGEHDVWMPIRKGKIYEAQNLARAILREKASGYPVSASQIMALFALLQPG